MTGTPFHLRDVFSGTTLFFPYNQLGATAEVGGLGREGEPRFCSLDRPSIHTCGIFGLGIYLDKKLCGEN